MNFRGVPPRGPHRVVHLLIPPECFINSPRVFVNSPVCAGGSSPPQPLVRGYAPSNPFCLFVLSFCLVCALGAKGLGLTTSTICPEGLVFVVNTFVVSKPHVYTLLFLLFNPTYHYCLFLVYLLVFTKPMPSAIRLHVFSSFTRFHFFSLLLVQNFVYCSQLHFTLIDSFIFFSFSQRWGDFQHQLPQTSNQFLV